VSLEHLESLLEHPGWALFRDHVKAEWAAGACWRKVKDVASRDEDIASAMQRVDYTNEQIGQLMEWPKEEAARLKKQAEQTERQLSRGGYHR
jgi:hypothetical protein